MRKRLCGSLVLMWFELWSPSDCSGSSVVGFRFGFGFIGLSQRVQTYMATTTKLGQWGEPRAQNLN